MYRKIYTYIELGIQETLTLLYECICLESIYQKYPTNTSTSYIYRRRKKIEFLFGEKKFPKFSSNPQYLFRQRIISPIDFHK